MKTIKLTKNKFAVVSDEDYEYLSNFKWCFYSGGYACRKIYPPRISPYKATLILMHREILERKLGYSIPEGMWCDHIDGNKLNNTRENLRLATPQQNNANRSRTRSASGFRGVCKQVVKSKRKDGTLHIKEYWVATIYHPTTKHRIQKSFPYNDLGKIDAANWEHEKLKEFYGEYAPQNI